ncbi:tripartite tricarboxylate transporter TctB family protein [Saccharospirillum sp.]|uniref:tripartite tricarboxylate transporter TctB family protein n=1 Tax=Saccharospirillum sp. TaxID=2033801 RepID=UPI0034A057C5
MNNPPNSYLPELSGAVFLIFVGSLGAFLASGYRIGSLISMGPGFYPLILSVLLIGLGIALAIQSLRTTSALGKIKLKGGLFAVAGVLSFSLLIAPAGVVPATFALVFLTSMGGDKWRFLSALLVSISLSLFSAFIFVAALGLPITLFGGH